MGVVVVVIVIVGIVATRGGRTFALFGCRLTDAVLYRWFHVQRAIVGGE